MKKLLLIAFISIQYTNAVANNQSDTFKTTIIYPTTSGEDSCCQIVFKTMNCQPSSAYINMENTPQTVPSEISMASWTFNAHSCGFGDLRSFLKFSTLISSIPSTALIDSVHLFLFGKSSPIITQPQGNSYYQGSGYNTYGTNEVTIERVLSPWNRTTLTWNNQPAVSTTNLVMIPTSTKQYNYDVVVDVTGMVKDMVAAKISYGFRFKIDIEAIYRSMIFHSCYATDVSKKPYLKIYYHQKGTAIATNSNNFNDYKLTLYPIPTSSILNVEFEVKTQELIEYKIMDLKGQTLFSNKMKPTLGTNTIHVSTDNLPQGAYMLYISDGINTSRRHFSKL